jgi:hypothetical protein
MNDPGSLSLDGWMKLISTGATTVFMGAVLLFARDLWFTLKDWGPKVGNAALERWDKLQAQRESDMQRLASALTALKDAFVEEQRKDRHDMGDVLQKCLRGVDSDLEAVAAKLDRLIGLLEGKAKP